MMSEPDPKRLMVILLPLRSAGVLILLRTTKNGSRRLIGTAMIFRFAPASARLSIAGVSKPAMPISPDDIVCAIKVPLVR